MTADLIQAPAMEAEKMDSVIQVEINGENIKEPATENMIINDEHSLQVVKLAAGGDDQSHVTLPQIKQLMIN